MRPKPMRTNSRRPLPSTPLCDINLMMKSGLTTDISQPKTRFSSCNFRVGIFAGMLLVIVWMTLIFEFSKPFKWTFNSKFKEATPCKCYTNHSDVKLLMESYGYTHATGNLPAIHCPITIASKGRLADQMCSYASLYSIAKLNDRPAFVEEDMENDMARHFRLSLPIITKKVMKKIPWTAQTIPVDWKEGNQYENLPCYPIRLEGSPCSWTFYNYYRNDIKKEFDFHPRMNAEVRAFLVKARHNRTSVTFVGVHVQRGDYINLMQNVYKGVLPNSQWIEDAMEKFRKRFNDALFVVSSDDKQWCKDKLDMSRRDVILAWNDIVHHPGRDLALLAHCNHSIFTVGEYGYWTAYLAHGEAIYATEFVTESSSYYYTRHRDSIALPHWEGMPVDLTVEDWL